MHRPILALTAATLGFGSLPALAVDNGIYLGASVGQAGVSIDQIEDIPFDYDSDSTAFKVIAGWRFLDWLAVEGNYIDLGSGDDTIEGVKFETDVSGVSISAVGFLPVGPVDLFARVGAVNWDADLSGLGTSASDDGTDLTYGVGAQFRVWGLSLRAEYEQFDIDSADTVDLVSVGVTWTFL